MTSNSGQTLYCVPFKSEKRPNFKEIDNVPPLLHKECTINTSNLIYYTHFTNRVKDREPFTSYLPSLLMFITITSSEHSAIVVS